MRAIGVQELNDDMLFLNAWPEYENEWDRGAQEGLKAVVRND